jgi:hypothetical protein
MKPLSNIISKGISLKKEINEEKEKNKKLEKKIK